MAILPKRLRKQVLRAGVALMLLAGFAFAEDLRAPAKEEALKAFIAHYLSPSGAAQTVQSPYVFAWADLKDDGQSEAITYLTGPGGVGLEVAPHRFWLPKIRPTLSSQRLRSHVCQFGS